MSVLRDSTSDWQKYLYDLVQTHYDDSPLPKSGGGGAFGRSAFGFITQTFNLPGLKIGGYDLGLSPTTIDDALRIGKGEIANAIFGGLFRQDQLNFVRDRYNQRLERHGYLEFDFKHEDFKLKLPFYENPQITENRRTDYSRNKIVNRTEPIRLWTGSEPVKYNVNFTLTLPHIIEFALNEACNVYEDFKVNRILNKYRLGLRDSFTESGKQMGVEKIDPDAVHPKNMAETMNALLVGNPVSQHGVDHASRSLGEPSNDSQRAGRNTINYDPESVNRGEEQLTAYVIHMVDTIRSSVVGSVKQAASTLPQSGPPTVTLKFGSLYERIPCIATSYNIKYDEVAGYHNYSKLPRRMHIGMQLESFNQSLINPKTIGGALNPSPGWNTIFKTDKEDGDET